MSDNPHGSGSPKVPLTWAQFMTWATETNGGPLCGCGEPTCAVSVPCVCPHCRGPLEVGIHVNAPTLIVGCRRCESSMLYLQLVQG